VARTSPGPPVVVRTAFSPRQRVENLAQPAASSARASFVKAGYLKWAESLRSTFSAKVYRTKIGLAGASFADVTSIETNPSSDCRWM